jgi:membrane protein DedA with SNARE-associated domain
MGESFLLFVKGIKGPYLYLILFVSACFENYIPPIPGDTVTLFGAYLVGIGQLHFFGVLMATVSGNFIGFMVLFFLGKYLGREFFYTRDFALFSREKIQRAEQWFQRYGTTIILFNRFLSGTRAVISIFAGIANMNNRIVALYCLISCLVWNSMLVYSGYKAGENWEAISNLLKKYNWTILFILLMVLLFFIFRFLFRKSQK